MGGKIFCADGEYAWSRFYLLFSMRMVGFLLTVFVRCFSLFLLMIGSSRTGKTEIYSGDVRVVVIFDDSFMMFSFVLYSSLPLDLSVFILSVLADIYPRGDGDVMDDLASCALVNCSCHFPQCGL